MPKINQIKETNKKRTLQEKFDDFAQVLDLNNQTIADIKSLADLKSNDFSIQVSALKMMVEVLNEWQEQIIALYDIIAERNGLASLKVGAEVYKEKAS